MAAKMAITILKLVIMFCICILSCIIIMWHYSVADYRADFSDQFKKNIVRYKRIGYNINIMRVFNPITVNNFASLFNCMPVGRASDSMMAPT